MSLRVKPNHPLSELLAQLLFSIETIPPKQQRRAVNRACREAVKWHKNEVSKMEDRIKELEKKTQLRKSGMTAWDRWGSHGA